MWTLKHVDALAAGARGIFNTDRGSQFTSEDFTRPLLKSGVRISMDGRGRALDYVFIEGLWRTVIVEGRYVTAQCCILASRFAVFAIPAALRRDRFWAYSLVTLAALALLAAILARYPWGRGFCYT